MKASDRGDVIDLASSAEAIVLVHQSVSLATRAYPPTFCLAIPLADIQSRHGDRQDGLLHYLRLVHPQSDATTLTRFIRHMVMKQCQPDGNKYFPSHIAKAQSNDRLFRRFGRDICAGEQVGRRPLDFIDLDGLADQEAGIYTWDVAADLVYGDTAVAALFGLDPHQTVTGLPLATYIARIHPDDQPAAVASISNALKATQWLKAASIAAAAVCDR